MEIIDLLYQAINEYGEKRILSDIAQGESTSAISALFEYCIPTLEKIGKDNPENHGALAEGLIHYLLTIALIPSQRKITVQTVNVDVAVPDTKTLTSSPDDAIVISFLKTKELDTIIENVNKLKKIQPKAENIWIVADEPISLEGKIYTLDKDKFTFSNIINDLISFTSNKKQSKLKIFRI